jgi:hypothetical protein
MPRTVRERRRCEGMRAQRLASWSPARQPPRAFPHLFDAHGTPFGNAGIKLCA